MALSSVPLPTRVVCGQQQHRADGTPPGALAGMSDQANLVATPAKRSCWPALVNTGSRQATLPHTWQTFSYRRQGARQPPRPHSDPTPAARALIPPNRHFTTSCQRTARSGTLGNAARAVAELRRGEIEAVAARAAHVSTSRHPHNPRAPSRRSASYNGRFKPYAAVPAPLDKPSTLDRPSRRLGYFLTI